MSFWTEVNRDALTVSPETAAVSPIQRGFPRNFEIANDVALSIVVAMAVAIILGVVLARATSIVARNPVGAYRVRQHPLSSLIGLVASASGMVMFLVGLWITRWYWPVGFLSAGFLLSGLLLNRDSAASVYDLNDGIGLVVLAATLFAAWSLWV